MLRLLRAQPLLALVRSAPAAHRADWALLLRTRIRRLPSRYRAVGNQPEMGTAPLRAKPRSCTNQPRYRHGTWPGSGQCGLPRHRQRDRRHPARPGDPGGRVQPQPAEQLRCVRRSTCRQEVHCDRLRQRGPDANQGAQGVDVQLREPMLPLPATSPLVKSRPSARPTRIAEVGSYASVGARPEA